MRVTLRTLMAGPKGITQPGETAEVADAEAMELLRGGYAVPADPASEKLLQAIKAETAASASKAKRA